MCWGEGRKNVVKKEVIALLKKNYSSAASHLQRDLKCSSPRKNENQSAKFEAMKINKERPKLLATHSMTGLV